MSSASAKLPVSLQPSRPDPASGGRPWLTALWCSFLAAALATMFFFAFVDPTPVVALLQPTVDAPSRTALYSLGFFFFWTFCALAAGLTAWLMRTPPP